MRKYLGPLVVVAGVIVALIVGISLLISGDKDAGLANSSGEPIVVEPPIGLVGRPCSLLDGASIVEAQLGVVTTPGANISQTCVWETTSRQLELIVTDPIGDVSAMFADAKCQLLAVEGVEFCVIDGDTIHARSSAGIVRLDVRGTSLTADETSSTVNIIAANMS